MLFPAAAVLHESGFLPALLCNLVQAIPHAQAAQPLLLFDLPLVSPSLLACSMREVASSRLPKAAFNHNMRAYHFGLAIRVQELPQATFSDETF